MGFDTIEINLVFHQWWNQVITRDLRYFNWFKGFWGILNLGEFREFKGYSNNFLEHLGILSKKPLKLYKLCLTLSNFVWICLTLFNLHSYAQILCLLGKPSKEKTGNILVGGYPLPSIGKRPIYFRFFLLKASLSYNCSKNSKNAQFLPKSREHVGSIHLLEARCGFLFLLFFLLPWKNKVNSYSNQLKLS